MKNKFLFILALGLSTGTYAQKGNNVESLYKKGIEQYDSGDLEGALETYSQALEIDEGNASILYERALTYSAMGNCEDAVLDFKKALKSESKLEDYFLTQIYGGYANCLDDLGTPEAAVDIYHKAIEIEPENNMLYFNLGVTLLRMEEYNEAEEQMLLSANLAPLHTSSSYILSFLIHNRTGSHARSVYSDLWFLLLENEGDRATITFQNFYKKWLNTVSVEDESKTTVFLNLPGDDDENEMDKHFSSADMLMGITASSNLITPLDSLLGDRVNLFEAEDLTEEFEAFVVYVYTSITTEAYFDLEEMDSEYYSMIIPTLNQLADSEHFPTFCYYLTNGRLDSSTRWMSNNKKKSMEMYDWINATIQEQN